MGVVYTYTTVLYTASYYSNPPPQLPHKSGFISPRTPTHTTTRPRPALPTALRPLLEEARPLYEWLHARALRPIPAAPPKDLAPPTSPPRSPSNNNHPPTPKSSGTHAYAPDARNKDVLIGIRDGLTGTFSVVWRPMARVSVFDSGFMLGDGVWEGIRVHRYVLLC